MILFFLLSTYIFITKQFWDSKTYIKVFEAELTLFQEKEKTFGRSKYVQLILKRAVISKLRMYKIKTHSYHMQNQLEIVERNRNIF